MACQYGVQVDGFTVCFDVIVDPIVSGVVDPLENFFSSLYNSIISTLTSVIQSVEATLETVFNDIVNGLQTFITDLINGVESLATNIYNFLVNEVVPAITNGINTFLNALGTIGSDIHNALNTVWGDLSSGIHTLGNALSSLGEDIINDLTQLGNLLQSVFATVMNTVESGFNSFVSGIEHIGEFIVNGFQGFFTSLINGIVNGVNAFIDEFKNIESIIVKGLEDLGQELYNVLKTIVNDLLAGLSDLVKAFEGGLQGIIHNFMNLLQPRGRNEIQNVISEALGFTALTSSIYIGGVIGVKVLENLHPLHSLHLQEMFDKITELFAIHRIPEEIVAGFFTLGLFKQFEYALNYLLRPRLSDLAVESRAVWYGVETPSELQQALALEGYPTDLADKYIKTLYRPMPPFILRYLMETGLSTRDFLTKQLQMEGFDPQDIPFIAKIFDALELVPFQNQIKSVIYTYYKVGLMDDATATQIMNVFEIPQIQQKWILETAKIDFNLEQKQLLGQLALDLLAKAELTVEQTIEALTKIGYSESRAKLLANTRAVTQAPPPPKSTRALILQQALQNLSELGFG